MNIDTIVFDLGGVIIDLDEHKTTLKLAELAGLGEAEIMEAYGKNPIFNDYEKGLITDDNFRDGLRDLMLIDHEDEILDAAWNSMILDVPNKRLDFLNELRKKYKVCILSNTNGIHVNYFNNLLRKSSGKERIEDFADIVWFSHELHMRKPDSEIYEEMLRLSDAQAGTTLFLDDKKENLLGAQSVGIQTMHIQFPDYIFTLKDHVNG